MSRPAPGPETSPSHGGGRWLPQLTILMSLVCAVVAPLARPLGEVGPLAFMVLIVLLGLGGAALAVQQHRPRWAAANLVAGVVLLVLALVLTSTLA
ncbi:hypothetical protein ACTQ49_12250 [Luteococcus sp. Sow4_B9]|uniref:hypothetical protein n=1 Tax=Luteococcus sp. Sow4_B9 TaxID=3438792 RepID=UPI003F97352F